MHPSRLLFPALRWNGERYARVDRGPMDHDRDASAAAPPDPSGPASGEAGEGFGGFIVFGGRADDVRALTARLTASTERPLLFGADLERGAGQQFGGCVSLPPAAALAALDDLEVLWRAGELTAREASALGVRWIYAPVADLANEPSNPIVGTRAFGADPEAVSRAVTAWTLGSLAGGGLPCPKHFPGHGRTLADSHLALPVVEATVGTVADDLRPFAAAVEAGAPSVMSAHVAYPALDPSGRPATRSRTIIEGMLRGRLGFGGVVVSDALVMNAVSGVGEDRYAAPTDAIRAGVDALLYPEEPDGLAEHLVREAAADPALRSRTEAAERRLEELARQPAGSGTSGLAAAAAPEGGREWGRPEDRRWAAVVADRTLRFVGAEAGRWDGTVVAEAVEVVTIDDDAGGPFPVPDRSPFVESLRGAGVRVRESAGGEPTGSRLARIVAVYSDPRGWKGRAGLSDVSRRRAADAVRGAGVEVLFVLFGHPRLALELPADRPVLCAWGGEGVMQRAAARRLAAGAPVAGGVR